MSDKPVLTLADYRRHKELRPLLAQAPWCRERHEFYKIERKWDALPKDLLEHALERAEKAEAILAQLEKQAENASEEETGWPSWGDESWEGIVLTSRIEAARAQVEKDLGKGDRP